MIGWIGRGTQIDVSWIAEGTHSGRLPLVSIHQIKSERKGDSGALGSGNVINNASLVINRSGTVALTNNIFGTGSLEKGLWNDDHCGKYGADADTEQLWAVINHNSAFTVAPEPSTYGLLVGGTVTLAMRRRRRMSHSPAAGPCNSF